MTPPLPTECIEDIVSSIEDKGTLHSFLLANRYWCEYVIPLLWERPFALLSRPSASLIHTYTMCLSKESKLLLSSYEINLNSIDRCGVPLFDYAAFLRVLSYKDLCCSISRWLNRHEDYRLDKLVFLFARELCKLFMSRCSRFNGLYMDTQGMDTGELQMDYLLIPCFPGAEVCLEKLEHFTCGGHYNGSEMLCALSKVCKNIRMLDVYNSNNFEPMGGYLAMLIEAQKGLERFTLVGQYCFISDVILALNTQSRSLTYVELIINDFFEDDLSLSSLANCKNLETLIINDCVNLTTRKMLPLMDAVLPRIKTIVFTRTDADPKDVIRFIVSNSASVRNVSVMFTEPEEIPQLHKMLIACVQLEKLIISGWRMGVDEFLGEIGNLFPLKLRYLDITAEWEFEPASLKMCLDNCRSPLEYFGLSLCECLKDDHLEVIAEYSKKKTSLKHLKIFDSGERITWGVKSVSEFIDNVELVDPDEHISNTFDD